MGFERSVNFTLSNWMAEVEELLDELKRMDLGYPQGKNRFNPPPDAGLLRHLRDRFPNDDLSQMLAFYLTCDGASFPDAWNGYFIHSLEHIFGTLERGEPARVEGSLSREVLVLGSDGGGNMFAMSRAKKPEVLYLPLSGVTDSVYSEGGLPMRVLAPDFFDFLHRLKLDIEAFVTRKAGWTYMDGGGA